MKKKGISYYGERSSLAMNEPLEKEEQYEENDEVLGQSIILVQDDKIYISILGYIEAETYDSIVSQLLNILATGNMSDIIIFIDSEGGLVEPTMDIVRLLKAMDNKIITVAFNNCSSSACLIFSVGEERYMLSGTKFIMHKVKASINYPNAYMQDEEYIKIADGLKDRENEYRAVIIEGSNITNEKLDEIFSKKEDTILTEEEILKYKLATKIFKKFGEIDI